MGHGGTFISKGKDDTVGFLCFLQRAHVNCITRFKLQSLGVVLVQQELMHRSGGKSLYITVKRARKSTLQENMSPEAPITYIHLCPVRMQHSCHSFFRTDLQTPTCLKLPKHEIRKHSRSPKQYKQENKLQDTHSFSWSQDTKKVQKRYFSITVIRKTHRYFPLVNDLSSFIMKLRSYSVPMEYLEKMTSMEKQV